MFKKIKNLLLKSVWVGLNMTSAWGITFLENMLNFFISVVKKIKNFYLLVLFRNILFDIRLGFSKYLGILKTLIIKHRLTYIIRIFLLILFLYKPTLVDLDSFYWLFSIAFFFLSNTLFFLVSYTLPLWEWSLSAPSIKLLFFLSVFPAFYSSKKLKKRLKKKRKIILKDNELIFIFKWAYRIFVFSIYFLIFYFLFLFVSCILPFLYLNFFTNAPTFSIFNFFYFFIFKKIGYASLTLKYFLFYSQYIFYIPFFIKILYLYFYILLTLYVCPFLIFVSMLIFKSFFYYLFLVVCGVIYLLKFYFFYSISFINYFFLILLFFIDFFVITFDSYGIDGLLDVYKNFLFSSNFFILIYNVLCFILTCLFFKFLIFFNWAVNLVLPAYAIEIITYNFVVITDFLLSNFCYYFIVILDFIIPLLNSYFKDLTFSGLLATWYEYLNHNVQRGLLANSLINWLFVHIYASIIAFWFMDFDFRVAVKTPPKTPNTLLQEAKKTQDWIPKNMDFLSLQVSETKIYFAMLEISFEHVESLHFIYGDFEYIDEEFDQEDETPDEDDFYNESEETLKVREIIDSDLGFTKRPVKMSDSDPLDSKSSLERHYLSEIVGEPELIYVEEPLIWAFSSLYSPTFEELHFKDSLFSEWVFDPDEDLTFFEFLFLFPFLFFCVYVWFFQRRRKKHYRSYLRYFIPSRRMAFSGWWVEDFLGVPIGSWTRYFIDKMKHHTAPDIKFRRVHKFRMYRSRQKFKLMQMEAFHFDNLRFMLYNKCLKDTEVLTARSISFLKPVWKRRRFQNWVIKGFKHEVSRWMVLGDWPKFLSRPDNWSERVMHLFDSLQSSLNHLMNRFLKKRGRTTKRFRRNLWRTIEHIPGHLSMPYYPKRWYTRFSNTYLFYPSVDVKYNYSYYNYIGWRNNRSKWRRYAFMPGNVNDNVLSYSRDLQRRDYNLLKRWQKRRRFMRVFQF